MESGDACHGVTEVLEGGCFLILLLCAVSILAAGLLGALLFIQIGNMCMNLVSINKPYMSPWCYIYILNP